MVSSFSATAGLLLLLESELKQQTVMLRVVQYLTSLGIQAFARHSAFCSVQPAV